MKESIKGRVLYHFKNLGGLHQRDTKRFIVINTGDKNREILLESKNREELGVEMVKYALDNNIKTHLIMVAELLDNRLLLVEKF